MFTRYQLAKKYLHYWIKASNSKGHGVHSPFVFDFMTNVMLDKKNYDSYQEIEILRNFLLKNSTKIEVEDFGAGSSVIQSNFRVVKKIAASSLKSKKYAQLLFRMVKYYQPENIIELGTSLGITASYLASGNSLANVYTCEGSKNIAAIAQNNFTQLKLKNIELIQGDFSNTLTDLLNRIQKIDFAFIDGNHRKIPTLEYFSYLLNFSKPNTILVFDDIHWSIEMEEAWEKIQQHPQVTLTLDLFFIGIVFLNPDFKQKQHFILRY